MPFNSHLLIVNVIWNLMNFLISVLHYTKIRESG